MCSKRTGPRSREGGRLTFAQHGREVAGHELTHLSCRSWFSYCVQNKKKHLTTESRTGSASCQNCMWTIGSWNGRERKDNVDCRGQEPVVAMTAASRELAAWRMCAIQRELGLDHADLALNSDQEPVIVDFQQDSHKATA